MARVALAVLVLPVSILAIESLAHAGRPVYSSHFDNGPGDEWSDRQTSTTPRGNRQFLGPFTTHKVTLTLKELPPHKYVRVSIDLFIIMTWDGNGVAGTTGRRIGPDAWRMGVEGGPELVNATFSNMNFQAANVTPEARTQSYPSILPGAQHPARTGAAESNTLGYEWNANTGAVHAMDSVYRMNFVIRHEKPSIELYFAGGESLQPGDDECWALDAIKVEAMEEGEVNPPDPAGVRRLWDAIGGRDPVAETDAFWHLTLGGDGVVEFLAEHIKPARIDRRAIEQLIADLDGDDFNTREKATEMLKARGTPVEGILRRALATADSLEQRLRLEAVLRGLSQVAPADPESRRRAMALRLLNVIDTPAARKHAIHLGGR